MYSLPTQNIYKTRSKGDPGDVLFTPLPGQPKRVKYFS